MPRSRSLGRALWLFTPQPPCRPRLRRRANLAHKSKQLLSKILDQVRVQMGPLLAEESSSGMGSARSQQQAKFMTLTKTAGKRVQASVEAFQSKSKRVMAPAGAAGGAGATAPPADKAERALLDRSERRVAVQTTDRARTDLAREREQEAAAITHDMAELGSMMHDLVGDIDKAEANAREAEDAAKAGNKHLDGAASHQTAYRRKVSQPQRLSSPRAPPRSRNHTAASAPRPASPSVPAAHDLRRRDSACRRWHHYVFRDLQQALIPIARNRSRGGLSHKLLSACVPAPQSCGQMLCSHLPTARACHHGQTCQRWLGMFAARALATGRARARLEENPCASDLPLARRSGTQHGYLPSRAWLAHRGFASAACLGDKELASANSQGMEAPGELWLPF